MILVQLAASKKRERGRRLRATTATKIQGCETCVRGGRKIYLRTIRSTRVEQRKKDRLFKILYVTLFCYCFFFISNKILLTHTKLSLFEQGTIFTIITKLRQ